MENWVALQPFSSDEMKSAEMRLDEVRLSDTNAPLHLPGSTMIAGNVHKIYMTVV